MSDYAGSVLSTAGGRGAAPASAPAPAKPAAPATTEPDKTKPPSDTIPVNDPRKAPVGYRWTTEGAPPGYKILIPLEGTYAASVATTAGGSGTIAPGYGATVPMAAPVGERDYAEKPRTYDSASASYQAMGVAAGAAPTSMEALGKSYEGDLRGFANWMVDQKEAGKLGDLPMYSREKINTMTEPELKAFMEANPKMAATYFSGAGKPSEAARATPYGTGESGEVVVPTVAPVAEKPPIELGDGKPTPPPSPIKAPEAVKEAASTLKEENPDMWKQIGTVAKDLGMTALGLFQAFAMGQAGITDPEKIWAYREAARKEREKTAEGEKAEKEKDRQLTLQMAANERELQMNLAKVQAEYQMNIQNARNAAEIDLANRKFTHDMAIINASKGGADMGMAGPFTPAAWLAGARPTPPVAGGK